MSENFLSESVLNVPEEAIRLEEVIQEKETLYNKTLDAMRNLAHPKNPEAKVQRSLTVAPNSFAEFFTADFAYTAIPNEAVALVAKADPHAVVVYVRPYGPNGSTLGEGVSRPDRGRPTQMWSKSKNIRAASYDVVGNLQQTLWALKPGDAVFAHTAGKSKYTECYQISRPGTDRTVIAKRVPSRFEHNTGEVGNFNAIFVTGTYDSTALVNALKNEISQAKEEMGVLMRPVFISRLEMANQRLLALGLSGLELEEIGFRQVSEGILRAYDEESVSEIESLIATKEEEVKFGQALDVLQPRLDSLNIEVIRGERTLFVTVPGESKFGKVFSCDQEGLKELIGLVDGYEIEQSRAVIQS